MLAVIAGIALSTTAMAQPSTTVGTPAPNITDATTTHPDGADKTQGDRERLRVIKQEIRSDHQAIDAAREKRKSDRSAGDEAAVAADKTELRGLKAERKQHTQERKAIRADLRQGKKGDKPTLSSTSTR